MLILIVRSGFVRSMDVDSTVLLVFAIATSYCAFVPHTVNRSALSFSRTWRLDQLWYIHGFKWTSYVSLGQGNMPSDGFWYQHDANS